jgi:type II secretory pathway pseudopilin PulG
MLSCCKNRARLSPRSPRAFTITEVVLSLLIVLFMVVMVAAVVPSSLRTSRYSADFSQAASLVQHKINQLQDAGYNGMNGPNLGGSGLAIVDGSPSAPATNPRGVETVTFEFTDRDKIWQYFAGGMDSTGVQLTGANSPHGYIYLAPYAPSAYTNAAGASEYGLIRATVTVQWWTSKGNMQAFSGTTLIPRATVN